MNIRHLSGIAMVLLIASRVLAYGPGCPYGTPESAVVTSAVPIRHASVKWVGIAGSPSVADPLLVCSPDFKTMMWRRHERASDCIWIPQARITLRSGAGFVDHLNFKSMPDQDSSVGLAGDVVVQSPWTELIQTFQTAEMLYNTPVPQPKGVIALSARRLIDSSVTPIMRGIATCPANITRPWIMVEDPTESGQLNERTIAHEFGHTLGLCHKNPADTSSCSTGCNGLAADNLMVSGGTGAILTPGQCFQARAYLHSNTILDPPDDTNAPVNRVDVAFDGPTNAAPVAAFLDIEKIVAIDDSPSGGNLAFYLAMNGVVPTNQTNITYSILLDTDNNESTGVIARNLVPGNPIAGVEFVAQVTRVSEGNVEWQLYRADAGALVPVSLPEGALGAYVETISFVFCGSIGTNAVPNPAPFATEVAFQIHNSALVASGIATAPGAVLFPDGLRIQAVAVAPSSATFDFAPDSGAVLTFPEITFPTISIPSSVSLGETVSATVADMPPLSPLKLIIADQQIAISAMSDTNGAAAFSFIIPTNLVARPTLVTVGVMDPLNAATADTIVDIYDPAIPLRASIAQSGTNSVIVWNYPSASLEHALSIDGPWTSVPDAFSPWTVVFLNEQQFYRLRR